MVTMDVTTMVLKQYTTFYKFRTDYNLPNEFILMFLYKEDFNLKPAEMRLWFAERGYKHKDLETSYFKWYSGIFQPGPYFPIIFSVSDFWGQT